MARLLVVDDDPKFLDVLTKLLANRGYDIATCTSGDAALESMAQSLPDLLLCDINMKPTSGMQVLQAARERHPGLTVVMFTAYGSVETALESLRKGAFDYVTKPFRVSDFIETIESALAWDPTRAAEGEQATIPFHLGEIIAQSASMRAVCTMIERVAPTDATMLFRGERGSGKQLCGRTIHAMSQRRQGPFVVADCAAIPPADLAVALFGRAVQAHGLDSEDGHGLLQQAFGGTLWLSEIGILPPPIQERLLRVFKEQLIVPEGGETPVPVDARILAETAMDMPQAVAQGKFRADLYARFAPLAVEIKPLRERREDILPMFWHFFRQALGDQAPLPRVDPDARGLLLHYSWPGNVKELQAVVSHLVQAGITQRVTGATLPENMVRALSGTPIAALSQDDSGRAKSLKAFLMAANRSRAARQGEKP
ncbi:MAG: sigma-54 dependent transcriptional regulator [Lentisphaerae bacterium]|nr:sigma-54 dependent transcriptional regulator [Lentisphaerota bacterium]